MSFIITPYLDFDEFYDINVFMSSEFDWFMVTMPIFAIVVYLIVMVGAMEKQPKFLEEAGVKKFVGFAFVGLFGGGILISFYYMIKWFIFLVGNY